MNKLYFVKLRLLSNKERSIVCALALALCVALCLVFSGLMQGANLIVTSVVDRENQGMRTIAIQSYKLGELLQLGDYEWYSKTKLPFSMELLSNLISQPHNQHLTVSYLIRNFEFNSVQFLGRKLKPDSLSSGLFPQIYCVDPSLDTFADREKLLQNLHTYTDPANYITAGRDFRSSDRNRALVSEEQAYWLGFENPADIIGKSFVLDFQDRNNKQIVKEIEIIGVYTNNLTDFPDFRASVQLNQHHKDTWLDDGVILSKDFIDDVPANYLQPDYLTIYLLIDSVQNVLPTINSISAQFENYIEYSSSVDELNEISESIQSVAFILLILALILLFSAVAYIINMTLLCARDTKKSTALLKIVGYKQSDIRFINAIEYSIIATLASVISLAVSYITIAFINQLCVAYFAKYSPIPSNAFIFNPIFAVIAVLFIFALLIGAGLISVKKFAKANNIEQLKG